MDVFKVVASGVVHLKAFNFNFSIVYLFRFLLVSAFLIPAGYAQATPYGLDERPQNLTCVAPDRPFSNITTQRVFANLTFDAMISMSQPPSDPSRWFIAELTGVISSFDNVDSVPSKDTILNISSKFQFTVLQDSQQAGLTSFAIHPDFPDTPYIYVAFNAKPSLSDAIRSTISRFTSMDGGLTFDEGTEQILIEIDHTTPYHHVGQVLFGDDGYLYMGFGDSGNRSANQGQDLNDIRGSILRVDIDNGTPYSIPDDNPLVGTGFREEIFAWGFRNPWRFTQDKGTGQFWMGDVGESKWEEVNKVNKGFNYGWGNFEGPDCRVTNCDTTGLTFAELEFDHTQLTAVIGGYVYRGDAIPELQGTLMFADSSGLTVRGLMYDDEDQPYSQNLFESPIKIHSFAEGLDGEVYLLRGYGSKMYKVVPNGSSSGTAFPEKLSETGCFEQSNPLQPESGLIPFNVNTKLWSDGAYKKRWIALPDGQSIDIASDGDFIFPVGTVLIKEFLFDDLPFETRLLVRHGDGGWAGYSYEWEEDLSDANLLQTSKTKTLDNGIVWTYPGRDQCLRCHTNVANDALGPEILQLNADRDYVSTGNTANQLRTFEHINMFTSGLPARVAELDALSPLIDASVSAAQRARSYLHSNCSGCHRPGSPVTANIDLRYQTPVEDMNICNVDPEQGDLGVAGAKLLTPGDPSSSVLSLRMNALDENRMPPLGTEIVDYLGVALVDYWISQVDVCDPIVSDTTLYEDASDGTTIGWDIYDSDPVGASISNVYDPELGSKVIQISGAGDTNGFRLLGTTGDVWANDEEFFLRLKLNFREYFVIYVDAETTEGHRYLKYSPVNYNGLGSNQYVHHGLGITAQEGSWRTIVRDLQADLSAAQPGNMLLSINGILIRGSGKLDEISLLQQAPDSDSDEDGITDSDETNIYLTDPTLFDTDGDGLSDGVELNYWAGNWGADNDADGLYNIFDADSDNDGVLDGDEVAAGTNPGVADTLPPTVYEDAEDGSTLGWSLYDDVPVGAVIINVFDQQRQSRVVEFVGAGNSNGYILLNDQLEPWSDISKFVLRFAMKFDGYFTVTAKVRTTLGFRYLSYNPKNTDNLSSSSTITHGIGFDTRDNRWRTVTRDLQQDLADAQLGNQILEVDALIVRGNGRIDDVGLYDQLPATDADMDGIADNDEIALYGTNPTELDSDFDGLTDSVELAYWSTNWSTDYDGDGLNNLVDFDSDDDGVADGIEISQSTDPSGPAQIYEDAADGTVIGWDVYDDNPTGSIISNVYDEERLSRVIDLSGSGYSNGYRLRNADSSSWQNNTDFIVKWSMKTPAFYAVIIEVMTNAGLRNLTYKPEDFDSLGTGSSVTHGLGTDTKDNQWRNFSRNLQEDLEDSQSDVTILEVNAFLIRGSARVDDIKLEP